MGCSDSRNEDSEKENVKKEFDKFFYCSKSDKNLYQITSEEVKKLKVKENIKIYEDSALLNVESDKIIVIGGSDSQNNLTAGVFLIDCSATEFFELKSSPKSTKEGQILVKDNTLYFVGSTVELNSHPGSLQGGPVMIFNLFSQEWIEIPYNKILKFDFYSLVEKTHLVDDLNLNEVNFNLNLLFSPGAFLLDDRIYFIGGKIFDGSLFYPSTRVFSLGISHWDLRVEPITMPIKLINSSCIVKGSNVFITGGKLEDGSHNLQVFIFKKGSNNIVINYDFSFESKLEENYPPQISGKSIIFISYPKFWIQSNSEKNLSSYSIEKVSDTDNYVVKKTFESSSNPINAQYVKIKCHAFAYIDFVVTNGDFISDASPNMIPLIQSRVIDLSCTSFHVGEKLNVIAKPKIRSNVISTQQVVLDMNGKTAVFILRSNLLSGESLSLDFKKTIDEIKPVCPLGWNSPIKVNKIHYKNWSRTITASKIWTAAPRNFEEVSWVCNWGKDNGYLVRPRAFYGWSPLIIENNEKGKVFLVDFSKYPEVIKFNPDSLYGPTVTVSAGITLSELLTFLEQQEGPGDAPGWSFPHTPPAGHLTIAAILALNGHGSAIPVESEHFLVSYGSFNNLIVELWAVVTDPASSNPLVYDVKKFERKDKDMKAFLANVGRNIIVKVTLKVIPNYNLRCRSIVDLNYLTLFAEPANGKNPENSIGDLVEKTGRIQVFWFPFTEYPWVKVWKHEPKMPKGCLKVKNMNNYPFTDTLPDYITSSLEKINSIPHLTPSICKQMLEYSINHLKSDNLTDLWGPSKNTLVYVRDETLRNTTNGYAIHMNRAYIQQASHLIGTKFNEMLNIYDSSGKWPINSPLEIRITGLDKNEFNFEDSDDEFNRPVVSSLSYSLIDKENRWDVGLWVNIFTLPETKHSDEFYKEFEKWLFRTFNNQNAKVYVEWSKGWAYTTNDGPWTNDRVIQEIRKGFTDNRYRNDTWQWEKTTLEKYDAWHIFYSGLNRMLFS